MALSPSLTFLLLMMVPTLFLITVLTRFNFLFLLLLIEVGGVEGLLICVLRMLLYMCLSIFLISDSQVFEPMDNVDKFLGIDESSDLAQIEDLEESIVGVR